MRLIDAEQYTKRIYEHINAIEICPARSSIEKNKEKQQWKDALYDLIQMPTVNPYEWISVKDRLPEVDHNKKGNRWYDSVSIRVLCACKQRSGKKMVKEGYCEFHSDGSAFWRIPGSIDSVTHWMPLPTPPIEK